MRKMGILLGIVLLCFGCSVHQRGFTVISTKHVELSKIDLKETNLVRNQSGRDSRLWLLFIPLSGNPTLEHAVNECLENGKGDFIINPVVRSTGWSFFLLFSYGSWHITGDVGNSLAGKTPEQRIPASEE